MILKTYQERFYLAEDSPAKRMHAVRQRYTKLDSISPVDLSWKAGNLRSLVLSIVSVSSFFPIILHIDLILAIMNQRAGTALTNGILASTIGLAGMLTMLDASLAIWISSRKITLASQKAFMAL